MKNLFKNKEFQLDEIIFENRNKNYGAYALRVDSDRILLKSMFLGIGLFAAVAIAPLVMNAFKTEVDTAPPKFDEGFIITNVDPPVEPPILVTPTPPITAPVNTIDSRLPTPVRDARKETVMPKQTDYNDAVIGTENIVGEPPVVHITPPVTAPAGPATIPIVQKIDNGPQTIVDVEASFIGGIDSFRNKIVNNFDTSIMEGTGEVVRTTVVFIVEKDGTISGIKATGPNADFNKAAEQTIKMVRGKWVPAKLNGDNVRSYFKFPISMQFE